MEWLPPYPADNFCWRIVGLTKRDGKDSEDDNRDNDGDRPGEERFPGAWSLNDWGSEVPQEAISDAIPQIHCWAS